MGRICKKCGSELPEGTTRCIICGEEYVPDEATRGSGAGAKGGQGGKKRGFPLKEVLVGAVLVISAAGAFGALSLSGAKGEPAKEEPVKEEPVKEEPAKEEPAKEEPVKEEPVKEVIIKTNVFTEQKKVETPAPEAAPKPVVEKPAKTEPEEKVPSQPKGDLKIVGHIDLTRRKRFPRRRSKSRRPQNRPLSSSRNLPLPSPRKKNPRSTKSVPWWNTSKPASKNSPVPRPWV